MKKLLVLGACAAVFAMGAAASVEKGQKLYLKACKSIVYLFFAIF